MTKRSVQFPTIQSNSVPTGPLKTAKEKKEESSPVEENPLSSFFRKSKLSLTLPSKGQWYPEGSLKFDKSGNIPVYAMNAEDDIKFRTGDATMTGKNIYEVIKSCIPNILYPENIPHVDIDSIFLAIRSASYGPEFTMTVSVPNTSLTRKISINATTLLSEIISRPEKWDEDLTIEDESGMKLILVIHPIFVHKLFNTSKNIFNIRKSISKNIDTNENITNENEFSNNINSIASNAIDLLCSSIFHLSMEDSAGNIIAELDSTKPQDSLKIIETIKKIDIAYFNAIREHINAQRKKYIFVSDIIESSDQEIKAGAPKSWSAELTFMGSDFLPEQKLSSEL